MAVKPAVGSGVIEEKTIRTRQIPDPGAADAGREPSDEKFDPWEFIAALTPGDWATGDYCIQVERGEAHLRSDQRTWCAKYFEPVFPETIQKEFGGGTYTVWLKIPPKARQLKWKGELKIEGSAKPHTPGSNGNGATTGGLPAPTDALGQVIQVMRESNQMLRDEIRAMRGGPSVDKAIEQAVGLSAQVFGAAIPAVTGTLSRITAGGADSELDQAFKKAMIERLLNPQPASTALTDLLGLLKLAKENGLVGGNGAPRGPMGFGVEIIREIPTIVNGIKESLAHYAYAMDAQARIAAMGRTGAAPPAAFAPPAPPVNGQTPNPPPAPAIAPPPAKASPSGAPLVEPGEVLDMQIVSIATDPVLSIEEAAAQLAVVMNAAQRGLPENIAAMGEEGILQLFRTRPILAQQVPQNPRLPELIKKFIEIVKAAPVFVPPAGAPAQA